MKQTKKGFSLAEVLIAMGIISVIATIGFTIGRRGVESAYNQYIYTGYKGMSMAIANAVNEGFNINNMASAATDNTPANDFVKSIARTLSVDYTDIQWVSNTPTFTVANGTIFTITCDNTTNNNCTVKMDVPTKKTRRGSTETICLDYLPNKPYGGVLLPVQNGVSCASTIPNIGSRKDLLPFFIDDGIAGRVIPKGNNTFGFQKRQYYSIQEALCHAYTGSFTGSLGSSIANCTGRQGDIQGAIKAADPRKVN